MGSILDHVDIDNYYVRLDPKNGEFPKRHSPTHSTLDYQEVQSQYYTLNITL